MRVIVTDVVGQDGTVVVEKDAVAKTIAGWFPDAPVETFSALADLQVALNHGEPTDALEVALGIVVNAAADCPRAAELESPEEHEVHCCACGRIGGMFRVGADGLQRCEDCQAAYLQRIGVTDADGKLIYGRVREVS